MSVGVGLINIKTPSEECSDSAHKDIFLTLDFFEPKMSNPAKVLSQEVPGSNFIGIYTFPDSLKIRTRTILFSSENNRLLE